MFHRIIYWHSALSGQVFAWLSLYLAYTLNNSKGLSITKEQRSQLFLLLVAAVIISVNWFTYIWAIANNQVMNTSLGYYINPLFNVVLGVILFKEVLSIPKKLSVISLPSASPYSPIKWDPCH